jgi:hypothetical protein
MIRRMLKLQGPMLFTAALAAATTAALAAEPIPIKAGDVCEKKVAANSWHVCGAAPGTGQMTVANTGVHQVTVFTTGPDGVQEDVSDKPIGSWEQGYLDQAGVVTIERDLPTREAWQTDVEKGQLVYIARSDHMVTQRTITVQFTAAPGS